MHIADEIDRVFPVLFSIVITDHIIEALKPDHPGDFVATVVVIRKCIAPAHPVAGSTLQHVFIKSAFGYPAPATTHKPTRTSCRSWAGPSRSAAVCCAPGFPPARRSEWSGEVPP